MDRPPSAVFRRCRRLGEGRRSGPYRCGRGGELGLTEPSRPPLPVARRGDGDALEWEATDRERSGVRVGSQGFAAQLYAAFGEKVKSLDPRERDFGEGDRTFWYSNPSPEFRAIRDEPRSAELLQRYRLPPVKEQRPTGARGPAARGPRLTVTVR